LCAVFICVALFLGFGSLLCMLKCAVVSAILTFLSEEHNIYVHFKVLVILKYLNKIKYHASKCNTSYM